MRSETTYRIGPAERPSEYHVHPGDDVDAAFAVGRRRWPGEPLLCLEMGSAPPLELVLTHGRESVLVDRRCSAHLN